MTPGRLLVIALSLAMLGGATWASFSSAGIALSRDVGVAAVARGESLRGGSILVGGPGQPHVK